MRSDLRHELRNNALDRGRLRKGIASSRGRAIESLNEPHQLCVAIRGHAAGYVAQHEQVRVVEPHEAGPEAQARAGISPILHGMMTGVAVEQHELGKKPVATAP